GPADIKFLPKTVSGNRALALAYVNAKAVMDRLDDVLGVNGWSDEYLIDGSGNVVCRLSCYLPSKELNGEWVRYAWITKTDVGSLSEQPDAGDRLKSAFSDSFKRAAVKFGVGRFLYRLPSQWADYDPQKKQFV